MAIGAFKDIIPVVMTERLPPDPGPQVFIPESGSRWGKTSEFQFSTPETGDVTDQNNQQSGNGEVWDDDKYETEIIIEALWSPASTESGGGTWADPFGIKRSFTVYERDQKTTVWVENCGDDGPTNVSPCVEGTIQPPPEGPPGISQPFHTIWQVQSTNVFEEVDMGDTSEKVPIGIGPDGQQIFQNYLVHRKATINFSKDFGRQSGKTGFQDIPDMPTSCDTCRD